MVAPLILSGVLTQLIGFCVIGINVGPFGTWRASLFQTLFWRLSLAITLVVMLLAAVELVQRLAPYFSGNATRERAVSLVVHAMLPWLSADIIAVEPIFGSLAVILELISGLVGLYAFYEGVSVMTSVTEQQRLGFTGSFVGIMILACVALFSVTRLFVSFPAPPLF
jgi:hypothetical protein